MSFSALKTTLALVLPLYTVTSACADIVLSSYDQTCTQIANSVSSASTVYWPDSLQYLNDINHWAISSTQQSACSIEPGTAEDVGKILQILGNTSTPFAVKGGGHASNPNFSSTPGVHIAMSRFSDVTYDAGVGAVVVGSGLIWDDVYAALAPYDVNVVGGRVTGVGVAGFTLGGGYSWKTNQYGLTVDTVLAYELVLPSGEVTNVTGDSDPDLFFALKGGMNNFGIVTRFTLKTFPQTQVWGGLITYTEDQLPNVNAATAKFQQTVTDPKAGIISTYNFLLGEPGVSELIFYDAPTPPDGIFDDFLAIPNLTKDISTRSFLSLVQSSPANATAGTRGIFNTVSMETFTNATMDAILNETVFWGSKLSLLSGTFISYDVEPFLSTILTHNPSATAYPPSRSQTLLPVNIYYAYTSSVFDNDFYAAARVSATQLQNVAVSEGQGVQNASVYVNYAIFDTQVEKLYGEGLGRMRDVRARVDPGSVMALAEVVTKSRVKRGA